MENTCPECQGNLGSSVAKCACCRSFRRGLGSGARRGALMCVAFLVGLFLAFDAPRQPRPRKPLARAAVATDAIAGAWVGRWTTPEGFLYEAHTRLSPRADGTLDARITWTLRTSPRPEEQAKLGLSGDELVRGIWDPASRTLRLEGYGLQDPHRILGMDSYRLVLSDDGRMLGGITCDHGTWNGYCGFTRAK